MSETQEKPTIFNTKIGTKGVELLANLYRLDNLSTARLCDEHIDRSGSLLGDVRTYARCLLPGGGS